MDTRVEIHGLDELRRNLRRVSPQLSKTLHTANKQISTELVRKVIPKVQSLPSPGGFKASKGITPRATQKSAAIAFSAAKTKKPVIASVLGSNVHPVFGRYMKTSQMSRPLWKPHLGSNWTPDQLYGVGPELVKYRDGFVMDEYIEAVEEAMRKTFT